MDYATKLVYQSNYWYNDGLKKRISGICPVLLCLSDGAFSITGRILQPGIS